MGPIPPPVYFLVAFVIGALIDYRWDSPMGGRAVTLTLGSLLLAAAAGLVGAAIGQFARAKTTVIPHHRVSALVARGPYRVSRNILPSRAALVNVRTCLGGAIGAQRRGSDRLLA